MARANIRNTVIITALMLGIVGSQGVYAAGPVAQQQPEESGNVIEQMVQAANRMPTFGWFGLLAAAIVGSSAYLGATLNLLRRDQRQAFEISDKREHEALMKSRAKDVARLLEDENGWRALIAQVAADVTTTAVAVDEAGVLNATLHPTPYFTVIAADGREFCFTVDPETLIRSKVISSNTPRIDVTRAGSVTSPVDLQLVWNQLTIQRRMANLALPQRARWFCIVKNPRVVETSRVNRLPFQRSAYNKR
jgi:hypothetical protein